MAIVRCAALFFSVTLLAAFCQKTPSVAPLSNRDSGDRSISRSFNARLPSWIRFNGELRERLEAFSGGGFRPDTSDAYDLHRLRVGITLQPYWWIKAYAETQDARAWAKNPALPPYQNTFDLRQAYVQLGDPERGGLALRAGRQVLDFGNGRLVGVSNWTNVARAFDAIRGTVQRGKYKVDAFASSVVIVRDGVLDHHNQGTNLHGLYGSLQDVIPNSTLEPYTLWRLQSGVATEEGTPGHLNQHTHGVRLIGKLPAHFDYRTEMAVQRGRLGVESIQAWMGHWVLGGTIPGVALQPRAFVEFNYASGDRRAQDGVTNTFDPIYPSNHDKTGLADQFALRNIQDLRIGADFKLHRRLALSPSIHDFWLANRHDALYSARGAIIGRRVDGTAGAHVGEELDVQGTYQASRQTLIGVGYAHIFTAEFLNKTSKGKDYNFPYLMLTYVF